MRSLICGLAVLLAAIPAFGKDVKLPILEADGVTYTNVTVTSATATDIYFIHSRGGGNAKLKDLSPELQQRFGYDAAKAEVAQKAQWESNARYRSEDVAAKKASDTNSPDTDEVEIPHPAIHAKSFLDSRPPKFVAEKWLTPVPNTAGKFVLVDFWATWCGPCRRSIPDLNRYQEKFSDKLVVVGLSNEPEAAVLRMESPEIAYSLAVDTQGRMMREAEVQGIPHCLVIDPRGIVRFEGHPGHLNDAILQTLFNKYGI